MFWRLLHSSNYTSILVSQQKEAKDGYMSILLLAWQVARAIKIG